MNFEVWDGSMDQLQAAAQGMPDPMTAMAIVQDAQNGKQQMGCTTNW